MREVGTGEGDFVDGHYIVEVYSNDYLALAVGPTDYFGAN